MNRLRFLTLWTMVGVMLMVLLAGCPQRPEAAAPTVVQAPPAAPATPAIPVAAPLTEAAVEPKTQLEAAAPQPPPPPVEPKLPTTPKPKADAVRSPAAKPPATPAKAAAIPSQPAPQAAAEAPTKAAGTVVVGTIETVSNVPNPSTVPYDTCVTFIKYRVNQVVSGKYEGEELLAVFWGMRKGELQPAARFSVGQSHSLTIEPFAGKKELERVMQADDTGEYSLTPYWVISFTKS